MNKGAPGDRNRPAGERKNLVWPTYNDDNNDDDGLGRWECEFRLPAERVWIAAPSTPISDGKASSCKNPRWATPSSAMCRLPYPALAGPPQGSSWAKTGGPGLTPETVEPRASKTPPKDGHMLTGRPPGTHPSTYCRWRKMSDEIVFGVSINSKIEGEVMQISSMVRRKDLWYSEEAHSKI